MSAYGVSGVVSALTGAGQLIGGLSMNPKRPTYITPSEITQNQQIAKNAYGASTLYGVPGQGVINNQMAQTYATNLQAIRNSQQNPAAMLAGITAANANQLRTNADIGLKAAADRRNAMNASSARWMAANKDVASYKDKAFQINEFDPYSKQIAAKSALIGSGIQNLTGGLTTLASAKSRKLQDDYYKKILGITV
jgi:hypothetical protein